MFDTNVTIVGNALTAPEWRRTTNTNSLVANFKVASTARRLDRETGRWVDGNSLRVRVNCWRKLAEGVAASVMVGDPLIVVGRLYTRDWTDSDGNQRTMYEMEAAAVGHDLSRGRGRFSRNRPTLATSALDDDQADQQVRGEATESVPQGETPARFGDGLLDEEDPDFGEVPPSAPIGYDPLAAVRGGGLTAGDAGPGAVADDDLAPFDELATDPLDAAFDPQPESAGDGPEPDVDPQPPTPAGGDGDATGPSRPRRARGRVPVPA